MVRCEPCLRESALGRPLPAARKNYPLSWDDLRRQVGVEAHCRELLAADLRPATVAEVPERYAQVHYTGMGATDHTSYVEPDASWASGADTALQVWAPRWVWVLGVAVACMHAPLWRADALWERPARPALLGPSDADMTRWWLATSRLLDVDRDVRDALVATYDLSGRRAAFELLQGATRSARWRAFVREAP